MDDRKPRIVAGQRSPLGALVRPCPKCHAPVGHRCRPLRQTGSSYHGDSMARVHRERYASREV